MKKFKSRIATFLTVILVIGTFLPWLGGGTGFAATISAPQNAGGIDYNDKVPSVEPVPVVVAPDLTVNADADEVFSGGNIKFEIAESSDPSEKMKLPDGQYTLEGGQVIDIISGVIYLDSNGDGDHDDPGEDIAKVNDTFNGDGKSLQIDFSTIPIPNGNFEAGSVGEISATNPIPNWKLNTSSMGPDGNPIDQIWLGPELATKTQGRTYDSVVNNGNGTYTVTGPGVGYTYNTNVNYNGTASSGDTQNIEGFEADFGSFDRYEQNIYVDSGTNSQALEIGFLSALLKTGDYAQKDGKIASSFGIEAISDPFEAKAGDRLGFDWKANEGGDDYEVYGFLVNEATGKHTEILYGRGSAQDWTTNSGAIPADGTYRFRFVSGSFNRTDGTTHGATLSIDNIRILSGKVVASLAEQIGQLVTYETTKLLGDRKVNITVTNGTGEPSNTTTVPILMDNVLKRSLTINEPSEGEIVYDPTPVIIGDVLAGSTVSVTVTGPGGYSYSGSAVVTDGNWMLEGISELTVPGVYTISATATNGEMNTKSPVESTFTFVNKTELEKYVDQVDNLNQADYQAGWEDDPSDDNIEFASALKAAQDLLDEIANMENTVNPDQDAVNKALKDLQDAKAALEKPSPVQTEPAVFEHGSNTITIDFDKNVLFKNPATAHEGFTVTVDNTPYVVTNAVANGEKVTLTVDKPLSSDSKEVKVKYDRAAGNLNLLGDEENGSADETFEIIATDDFGKALQIAGTNGNTDDRTTPFNGTVHPDADKVTVTIIDRTGNKVLENISVKKDGSGWSFGSDKDWAALENINELAPGSYTVQVTATDTESGRTVTKLAAFTIINKEGLQKEYNEVDGFEEEDYRAGWTEFEQARDHANTILNNRAASQEEVNHALTALEEARAKLEKHEPVPEKATFDHGHNVITVDFNKPVTFKDGEKSTIDGFTVTMDGEPIEVIEAKVINGNIVLTLAEGTELSSDSEVKVIYNKDAGESNLVGDEENGTAVEDFVFEAGDPFGHALQINKPNNITNDTTPTIEGTSDTSADKATITIIGPDGEEIVVDADDLIINPDGTWTYDIKDKLAPGEYDVVVTTTKEGRNEVKKNHSFIVVDKAELIAKQDEINDQNLKEDHYTKDSWATFINAYGKANEVIADPAATQDEVDKVKSALVQAYKELVYKKDLEKEVTISDTLVESHYSKASWKNYQEALKRARDVLSNLKATQEEVDGANAALKDARAGLTVDKALLEAEVKKSEGLKSADYSKASWENYLKALEAARSVLRNPNAAQAEIDAAFETLTIAQNKLEKRKSNELLPNTATNIYNWLIVGLLLLLSGFVLIILQKRRIRSQDV